MVGATEGSFVIGELGDCCDWGWDADEDEDVEVEDSGVVSTHYMGILLYLISDTENKKKRNA